MYRQITEIAMMTEPITMNGRNLPQRVLVRSISAPIIGSVMASQMRIIVTIREAYSPNCRILEPNCATYDRIRTKYTLVAPLLSGKSAS